MILYGMWYFQAVLTFSVNPLVCGRKLSIAPCSGPQHFWHQGSVSWKTNLPRTGVGGRQRWGVDGFGMI